eukprot:1722917-Amphidinium_carterae.1
MFDVRNSGPTSRTKPPECSHGSQHEAVSNLMHAYAKFGIEGEETGSSALHASVHLKARMYAIAALRLLTSGLRSR